MNWRRRRADVELLRRVVAGQQPGATVESVVETRPQRPASPSVFGVVARASGTSLLTQKSTLVAFSHAIEAECRGGLADAHLFGTFQRPEFYAGARATWAALAAQARSSHVFADFGSDGLGTAPVEVALDPDDPLRREWSVVVDRPGGAMALTALERPDQAGIPDRERLFDSAWTTNPTTVRAAARSCAITAGDSALVQELSLPPVPSDPNPALGLRLLIGCSSSSTADLTRPAATPGPGRRASPRR